METNFLVLEYHYFRKINIAIVVFVNSLLFSPLPCFYIKYSPADIDECISDPCQNGGTCKDEENRFTCQCTPGYDGVICDNGQFLMSSKVVVLFLSKAPQYCTCTYKAYFYLISSSYLSYKSVIDLRRQTLTHPLRQMVIRPT